MRAHLVAIGLLGLPACTPPPDPCASPTRHRWTPGDASALLQFPDDVLTREDPNSPTGLRVDVGADTPWLAAWPDALRPLARGLDRRSGFGRLGAIALTFSDDLGELPAADALRLVDLDADPPVDRPYAARLHEGGRLLVAQPLRPLRPGARHALVLSRDHVPARGACVQPAPALVAALAGDSAHPRVDAAYADLADRLGLDPREIAAATVFTTHDELVAVREVADRLTAAPPTWAVAPTCVPWENGRACAGVITVVDARGEGDLVAPAPTRTWELDVDLWLPPAGTPPGPLVLFGHGIDSQRGEGRSAARRLLEHGFAVAAVDALEHGTHPDRDETTGDALAVLGISLDPVGMDALRLGQNFIQTALDRVQLVEALVAEADVDGDGLHDYDPARVAYVGVSLGALMGPAVLALRDDIGAAALPVGGGHLGTFALENEYLAALAPLFESLMGSEAEWQKALAVGQAAMDPADPATWASHVLVDRLGPDPVGPAVVLPISMNDATVPVAAGEFLARALDLPHVPPVVRPVADLPVSGPAPLAANAHGVTAGFFQLDRVTRDGTVSRSEHWNTPWSDEGELLTVHLLTTWAADGTGELVDPYAALGTPPLAE